MSTLMAEAVKLGMDAINEGRGQHLREALAAVPAERVTAVPEDKLPAFIEALRADPALTALGQASPQALLKAFASLTHRMHADRTRADLRAQRDRVEGELLRRLGAPQA